jgi:hypothetical protein
MEIKSRLVKAKSVPRAKDYRGICSKESEARVHTGTSNLRLPSSRECSVKGKI